MDPQRGVFFSGSEIWTRSPIGELFYTVQILLPGLLPQQIFHDSIRVVIAMNTNTHSFFEQEIITRFKLFQERRSREEDEKILSLVSQEVWNEALRFLEELIPVEEQGLVRTALEENLSEETMLAIFKKYVEGEITAWRLRTRLSTFLDNLLIQSFTKL